VRPKRRPRHIFVDQVIAVRASLPREDLAHDAKRHAPCAADKRGTPPLVNTPSEKLANETVGAPRSRAHLASGRHQGTGAPTSPWRRASAAKAHPERAAVKERRDRVRPASLIGTGDVQDLMVFTDATG